MDQTNSRTPPETPAVNNAGDEVVKSGRNAAQGRTGGRTFLILLISLALIVVAFAIVYAFHAPGLGTNGGHGGASGAGDASRTFNAPEPSARPTPNPTSTQAPGEH